MEILPREKLVEKVFSIRSEPDFENACMGIFQYQAQNNSVYSKYLSLLKVNPVVVNSIQLIPFLPVEFFKTEKVLTGFEEAEIIFSSSTTGSAVPGKHYVPDISLYEKSFRQGFNLCYDSPDRYCILALLPSYLEREGSSLIYMMDALIKSSGHNQSGFYLDNHEELAVTLTSLKNSGQPTILVGVTFGLLDFIEKFKINFPDLIVMETGGMKGRREEIVREDVHMRLKNAFGIDHVHSEYGMTELLSQAYSSGQGIFTCPPWMRVIIRDPNDPFSLYGANQSGGINIIDLANLDSCAFIETQDLGRTANDGSIQVLGRFDNSDVRGCNLMLP